MTESTKQFVENFSALFDGGEGYGMAVILHPNYTSTSLSSASLSAKQVAEALGDLLYRWCIKNAKKSADSGASLDEETIYRNMRAVADAAYNMAVMQYCCEPSTRKDIDERAILAASAIRTQKLAQRRAQEESTPQAATTPTASTDVGASPKNTTATSAADVEAAVGAIIAGKKGTC